MATLQQAQQRAYAYACGSGKPHAIYNLNPYQPLYVVREARPSDSAGRGDCVEIIVPRPDPRKRND